MSETERAAYIAGFWAAASLAALCFGVVAIGPGNVDRAVALDLGIVLIAVALALLSALSETGVYMDAALVMAIVSFLVTIFVARALEEEKEER
jgi:multicomponent Na+:H+ antiporter subunit F